MINFLVGSTIILLLLSIAAILKNRKLGSELHLLRDDNIELMKNNQEIGEENERLKQENQASAKSLQNIYELIKDSKDVDGHVFDIINNKESDVKILLYKDFLIRCEEEIERKNRSPMMSFSVASFSIDFFKEYEMLYERADLDSIRSEIVKFLYQNLRKIDMIGKSEKPDIVYVLFPMTKLDGAALVSNRLQEKIKKLDINLDEKKIIVTITAAVCEVENTKDIYDIMKTLSKLKEEGQSSGGNALKVEKI